MPIKPTLEGEYTRKGVELGRGPILGLNERHPKAAVECRYVFPLVSFLCLYFWWTLGLTFEQL